MTVGEGLAVAAIGFGGGVFGGLLGIGGSIVMIPLLAVALGPNQQLYQAACMIVNVVVAISAVRRHALAGSVRRDCFRWMLPASAVAVLVGVAIGNRVPNRSLQTVFGVFLLYTAASECWRALRRLPDEANHESQVTPAVAIGVGSGTGLVAGLLGIGGGTIAVPLLRSLARLPLRQAIGTSSAVMVLASAIGAVAKNMTVTSLHQPDGQPITLAMSLTIAGALSPTAWVGAIVGARLTYALPLGIVRLAFGVLIALGGLRMCGLLG
ncbi:MAG: sulfite exporter TauE/SafE family protein [Phycisphaerales bacterium]